MRVKVDVNDWEIYSFTGTVVNLFTSTMGNVFTRPIHAEV